MATRLVALLVSPKDLVFCFWFNPCGFVFFFSSSTFHFESNQIRIDYQHNYVDLNLTLRNNVFS